MQPIDRMPLTEEELEVLKKAGDKEATVYCREETALSLKDRGYITFSYTARFSGNQSQVGYKIKVTDSGRKYSIDRKKSAIKKWMFGVLGAGASAIIIGEMVNIWSLIKTYIMNLP